MMHLRTGSSMMVVSAMKKEALMALGSTLMTSSGFMMEWCLGHAIICFRQNLQSRRKIIGKMIVLSTIITTEEVFSSFKLRKIIID